jgi:ATP-dependent exoDNAse (exonuclease V) alpha subunit
MCAFRPANPLIRETAEDAPLDQLEGTIERITFHNEENGYTVARLLPEGGRDVITILGSFSNPVVGESLVCHGTWTRHAQWGRQMQVARYEVVRPATAFAIEKYLGSGMVKGIGPVMAKRIVEKFGEEALDVIEEHPKKLLEIYGIGKKKLDQIERAWHDQREIRTIMLFLQSHGVSPAYAVKIYKTYGDKSIHVVEQNPYQLAQDIYGIGFKTADKIAHEMGITENDPRRIEAGVVYVLNESVESGGNAYLTADELDTKAREILAVESVSSAVDTLAAGGRLIIEPATFMGETEVAIYPPSLHKTECGLADRLKRLLAQPMKQPPNPAKFDAWLSTLLEKHGFPLSEEQRDAVKVALLSRFMVLTGGPGTGKCVRGDTLVLGKSGVRPILDHWCHANDGDTAMPDSFRPHTVEVIAKDCVTPTSHAYYGGQRETVRVTTHLGLELEGTPNHRVWAMTSDGPGWLRLDEIVPGTPIAVRRGDDVWGDNELSQDLAYLFGVISGDGGQSRSDTVTITNNDLSLLERCRDIFATHFGTRGCIVPTRNTFDLRLYGIGRRERLSELGLHLCRSEGKVVPSSVLCATRACVIQYLAGLFDTDGNIHKRANGQVTAEITLKSRELIRQLQVLLLNLGMVSCVSRRTITYRYRDRLPEKRDYWRLSMMGRDVDLFMKAVPTRKAIPVQDRICNTNRDTVPLPGQFIRHLFTHSGRRSRREWWAWKREIKGERSATRERLLHMLETYAPDIECRQSAALQEACRECYYWDRVVTTAPATAQVYDLSVPGEESFVANGFVNHNTTSTKAIVTAFEALNKVVLIASPTGRAAKRASEVTGREAKTVHRLLEFDPEQRGFKRGPDSPLECDVLIVDECSMLDMVLSYSLLKAVPNEAQVVFVGDVDQLPSVGPGNVLRDLIDSGVVPVARLSQVFRQAAQSLIITNAHAINQGKFPSLPPASEGRDCAFVKAEEPEEVAEKIVAVVARSLPKRGYLPGDIQVLTPMQRGSAGAAHLNTRLQETLNPPLPEKAEVARGSRLFRVGDRVMQMVNNYDKGVYNGDIGVVASVSHEESVLGVQFTDAQGTTDVSYEFSDMDELTLAFATSIHKAQGSEYPVVVLAIHTQHYMLLQRNLLYTALTRAKKFAVLVGSQRAIAMAVKKQSDTKRHTRLKERLQGTLE